MAYKILKTYLTPDIVDYCVLPYLLPSEEDAKQNHKLIEESFSNIRIRGILHSYMHDTFVIDDSYKAVSIVLRHKLYKNKRLGI